MDEKEKKELLERKGYWFGKLSEPTARTCNLGFKWLPENFNVHQTFDGQLWAAYFLETLRQNPDIIIDHELMYTWFANALMRGYDESRWQSLYYKRSVRRALFPWWNWKHWGFSDVLCPKLLTAR